jgi:hypothetical protein
MAGLHVPLSTLHVQPCDCPRMTRGQVGSLLLTCATLTFATPRRFIPAHSHFVPTCFRARRDSAALVVATVLMRSMAGRLRVRRVSLQSRALWVCYGGLSDTWLESSIAMFRDKSLERGRTRNDAQSQTWSSSQARHRPYDIYPARYAFQRFIKAS